MPEANQKMKDSPLHQLCASVFWPPLCNASLDTAYRWQKVNQRSSYSTELKAVITDATMEEHESHLCCGESGRVTSHLVQCWSRHLFTGNMTNITVISSTTCPQIWVRACLSEPPWLAVRMMGRRRCSSWASAATAGHELMLSEKKRCTDFMFRNLSHLLQGWVLCVLSAAPLVLAGVLALSSFLTHVLNLPRAALV